MLCPIFSRLKRFHQILHNLRVPQLGKRAAKITQNYRKDIHAVSNCVILDMF